MNTWVLAWKGGSMHKWPLVDRWTGGCLDMIQVRGIGMWMNGYRNEVTGRKGIHSADGRCRQGRMHQRMNRDVLTRERSQSGWVEGWLGGWSILLTCPLVP